MSEPMALSTAIRLGSMLRPQAFDSVAGHGSCALRAAAEAGGIADAWPGQLDYAGLLKRWPVLRTYVTPPVFYGDGCDTEVCRIIYFLNDTEHWTRERIADWVSDIETKHDAASVRTETEVTA